jgi:electron transport complex protein RnfA
VALLNVQKQHGFIESALYGMGGALGFTLVMVMFASIRERLVVADIPQIFKGNAIGLVTAGLMALSFMGFSGLVKH